MAEQRVNQKRRLVKVQVRGVGAAAGSAIAGRVAIEGSSANAMQGLDGRL
jgi:hypothetical protein